MKSDATSKAFAQVFQTAFQVEFTVSRYDMLAFLLLSNSLQLGLSGSTSSVLFVVLGDYQDCVVQKELLQQLLS